MKPNLMLCALLCCVLVSACSETKNSPRGFSLPEGDVLAGKATFIELQCNACHSTKDVEQLEPATEESVSIKLGREVGHVKTYADLVTSIINPSHRLVWQHAVKDVSVDGESKMRNYNSTMTVDQLINLVTYLQPHYPFPRVAPPGR